MRVGTGLGFLALGIASGVVLAVPAAAASDPSAAAHDFNSTASATPGNITIDGTKLATDHSVTATDAHGSQSANTSLPATTLMNELGTIPSYANVVSAKAVANRVGASGACSAIASGVCAGTSTSPPLTVNLSFVGLFKLLMINPPPNDLPSDGLSNYNIVLSFTGPAAACVAGPDGGPGSDFTAAQTPASGLVDIVDGSTSIIGGPKKIVSGTDVLSGLPPNTLSALLAFIPANTVDVTFTPGSSSGSGPKPVATAGQLALQVHNTPVLSLAGGNVSCGANQPVPVPTVSPSSPASSSTPSEAPQGAGTSTPPAPAASSSSSSSEVALHGGIQSDEGRYVPASNDTPLWAGLVGGGAALAGGIALWRRRLRRS